jgi:hypothetical protein
VKSTVRNTKNDGLNSNEIPIRNRDISWITVIVDRPEGCSPSLGKECLGLPAPRSFEIARARSNDHVFRRRAN